MLVGWGSTLIGEAIFGQGEASADLMAAAISLALIIPTLAAGSRRLYDTGRSGWWQLLILTIIGITLLIIWWATDTKTEADKYDEGVADTA
jgi:uncharacterized membrane protein YhaH (DUF805 family)